MARGIIRQTPTSTGKKGRLNITILDDNSFGVLMDSPLNFIYNENIAVQTGDLVECTIDSAEDCTVTRVLVRAADMSEGILTQQAWGPAPGRIKVTRSANNEMIGKSLKFSYYASPPDHPYPAPDEFPADLNDNVKILITSDITCDFIEVIQP